MSRPSTLVALLAVTALMLSIYPMFPSLLNGQTDAPTLAATGRADNNTAINTTYSPGEIEWKVDLSKGKTGYVGTPSVADLDGDGYVETLLVGNSYNKDIWDPDINFSSELFCLDHQGNTKWKFLLSDFWFAVQSTPVVCDLEGDGQLEILIGGETSSSWFDSQGKFYCLDASGGVKWVQNYTSFYSYYSPAVGDINNDNKLEIVFSTWSQVICLDFQGEILWSATGSFFADFGFSPTIADLYNDGSYEVVVESWRGLYCFQGDPSDKVDDGVRDSDYLDPTSEGADLLWNKEITGDWGRSWWMDSTAIADLTGDSQKELITSGASGEVICLNSNGRTVWTSSVVGLQSSPVIGDVDGDGHEEIIALSYIYNWTGWVDDDIIVYGDGTRADNTRRDPNATDDDTTTDDDVKPPPQYYEEYSLNCIDGQTGVLEWKYPLSYWGQVCILGDVDNDRDLRGIHIKYENIVAIDGDENGNGEIDESEVLWEFRSGWIWGWSNTFALADVDHDGQLELLATANEILYCLSVGGNCPKGTIEWGKIYFDLGNTNHYVSGIQSGVKIYPRTSAEAQKRTMIKYGEPGELVTYELMVKNVGTYDAYYGPSAGVEFEDTFRMRALDLPAGWSATFDVTEFRLAPQAVRSVDMKVQIPFASYSKSSANIKAQVFAKASPGVNDTQETVTIVKGEFNLKLACADQVKGDGVPADDERLTPQDTTIFRLTITNLGSRNDTALMTLAYPFDWEVSMNLPVLEGTYSLNLGSGESRNFFIFANIPANAVSGDYPLNITATSVGDPEIKDSLVLSVKVNAFTSSIYLFCNGSAKYVKPGQAVTFNVTVLNFLDRAVQVGLNYSWAQKAFAVTQDETALTVGPGEKGHYTVTVTCPSDALADTLCSVYLTAYDSADPRMYDTLTLWALVEHVYDIAFTMSAQYFSIMPGSTLSVKLNTTNLGNGYDHYGLLVDNLSGYWDRALSHAPTTLDARTLTKETLTLNITVPRRTPTGFYNITLTAKSEGGKLVPRQMAIYAEEYLGVAVTVEPRQRSGGPGKEITFRMNLTNLGNGPQVMNPQVLNPQTFDFNMGKDIDLGPFEGGSMEFTVHIPSKAALTTYNFTLGVSALSDPENTWNLTYFRVMVTSPDLVVGEAALDVDRVSPGSMVSVRTKVQNIGNAPAENVTVGIYESGSSIPMATQHFDVVSGEQEVYLQWIVKGSNTDFVIKADPNNTVEEINEMNNDREFSYKKEYRSESGWTTAQVFWIACLIGAGLLLALTGYAVFLRRKEF